MAEFGAFFAAMHEVVTARGYHRRRFDVLFGRTVATNASLTDGTYELAPANGVGVYARSALLEWLSGMAVSLSDVLAEERWRLASVA